MTHFVLGSRENGGNTGALELPMVSRNASGTKAVGRGASCNGLSIKPRRSVCQ